MWATAEAFPEKAVINRGFGGSHLSDVNHYFDNLVKPYGASSIFLYAGDNDIDGGKSAERVLADVKAFVVRADVDSGNANIYFLSIKPSKSRWMHWPELSRANQLISEWSASKANVTYVDMASVLLDEAGEPMDVFIVDGLHLNKLGYQLWAEAIAPYVE